MQTVCETEIIIARGRVRIVERFEVLTRPASPAFEVRVFGRPELLADRIRREGLEVQQNSQGTLTLADADESVAQRVWNWAREAGVGIRAFSMARTSLEQIFLDAVREDDRADS